MEKQTIANHRLYNVCKEDSNFCWKEKGKNMIPQENILTSHGKRAQIIVGKIQIEVFGNN